MTKWKIYVVPHTHWDREWYFSQSRANTLLVNNMKEIIKVLETNSKYHNFVLDGQMSVINDLEANHKNLLPQIKALAKSNKLLLGPWYSQPDSFNSLGESIIRNLEYGISQSQQYGNTLDSAYLPDSFGFNHNLPQIFNYFELKNMIFWRGMKKEDNDKTIYFNWTGVDGSSIPAYCYNSGYWVFGGVFPYCQITQKNYQTKTQKILADLKPHLEKIKARSNDTNKSIILPFGGDEGPITNELTLVIEELNKIDDEHSWEISNFKTFFNDVPDPTYEIKDSLHWPYLARIHRTIASSRYDIKKLFRHCETKLYYELEPLQIIYRQIDSKYHNQEIIDEAMKKILVSQAHDSLGCCNSDITNRDITNRLTQALEIIKMEIAIIKKKLFHKLNLNKATDVLCFNLAPYARAVTFDSVISSTNKFIKSKEAKLVLETRETTKKFTLLEHDLYYEHQVSIKTPKMKGLSFQIMKIVHSDDSKAEHFNKTNMIGNPEQQIWVYKDSVYYSEKDEHLKDFINILPFDDYGDSYDFSPNPQNDKTTKISATNKVTHNISHRFFQMVSFVHNVKYSNDLEQKFMITIKKWFDKPYDLTITTDNKSIDTKWVLNIGLDEEIELADVYASQSLAIDIRTDFTELDWRAKGYPEFPCPIATNDGLIHIPKVDNFSLLTLGNNEFRTLEQSLQVTLFRSYGKIGRPDLIWRPGRPSGISLETPDAQLQKELQFDFQFTFKKTNIARILNDWFFKADLYYANNPNDLDFYADRFVVNYEHQLEPIKASLNNLEIDSDFFVSSFRIFKNRYYKLRISNLNAKSKTFTIKKDNHILEFAIEKHFQQKSYSFINEEVEIKPQQFLTIIIKI